MAEAIMTMRFWIRSFDHETNTTSVRAAYKYTGLGFSKIGFQIRKR